MRIAICDDEPIFMEKLQCELNKLFARHDVDCSFVKINSGEALLDVCSKEKIDAVFLDVAMPGLDGYETADRLRALRENIILVFVSSKHDTVFDSYEYGPVWFVPKNKMKLLRPAVDKIVEKSRRLEEERRFVQLKLGNKILEIDINEVRYFKNSGHYVSLVGRNGKVSDSFRCKMDDIEKQLDSFWFVRVHNRFLVNLRVSHSISSNFITLYNKEQIPISRSKVSYVKEKFQDYLRSIR